MKRPLKNQLLSSRTTIWFNKSLSEHRNKIKMPSLYSHMLIEDLHAGIMPYSFNPEIKISLAGDDSNDLRQIIAKGLNNERYCDLSEAVASFIRQCTNELMYYPKSEYEIVYYSNKQPSNEFCAFALEHVPYKSLKRLGAFCFQILPRAIAQEKGVSSFIKVLPKQIITFELPARIKYDWFAIIKLLDFISRNNLPELALMSTERASIPFDINKFYYSKNLLLAKSTKTIGWNARHSFENMLEYYTLTRFLRFERLKIEIRDAILIKLNEVLKQAGKKMNFRCQLHLVGLLTLEDIDNAEKELQYGNTPFKQIIDKFRKRI